MLRRRPRGETTLSQATYDKQRTRGPAPLPDRHKEAIAADAAKSRKFDERVNKEGLAVAYGLIKPKPPEPPPKRRKI
jgi:hypothetical protein